MNVLPWMSHSPNSTWSQTYYSKQQRTCPSHIFGVEYIAMHFGFVHWIWMHNTEITKFIESKALQELWKLPFTSYCHVGQYFKQVYFVLSILSVLSVLFLSWHERSCEESQVMVAQRPTNCLPCSSRLHVCILNTSTSEWCIINQSVCQWQKYIELLGQSKGIVYQSPLQIAFNHHYCHMQNLYKFSMNLPQKLSGGYVQTSYKQARICHNSPF